MTDIVEGRPQGLALDMMHARAIEGFSDTGWSGTNRYDETAGSALCVIAAGQRREAGMSRGDLLDANAKVVAEVDEASWSNARPMLCSSSPPTRSTRCWRCARRSPDCPTAG